MSMVTIRQETSADQPEVDRLMALGFAPSHASRNIWSLRNGAPVAGLCLVAEDKAKPGHLLGSIRYWPITIAGTDSLLLGPLAVDPDLRGQGIGRQLVRDSLDLAAQGPWDYCFVSGERDYYPKLGFTKLSLNQVDLIAPIEEERLHLISVSAKKIEDLPTGPWAVRPI